MVLRQLAARIGKGLDRFLVALDAEGVGLFQALVYVHVVGCAIYLMTAASGEVPQAVDDVLGDNWNAVWLWLCMGPAVCLLGKVLTWFEPTRYTGYLMELSGDLFGLFAFIVYVLASVETAWWGRALFAVFVCASIGECILLLVVRDIRRIAQER